MPNASQCGRHNVRAASLAPAAFRSWLFALALMLSAPVPAAGLSCSQPASAESPRGVEELDEVVVSGEQVTTSTKDVLAWPALLPERYTYEGFKELLSFAAVTDEPPPEVAAAGHDRMIVNLKPENVDAWLSPQGRTDAELQAILSDRQAPYYEHELAT